MHASSEDDWFYNLLFKDDKASLCGYETYDSSELERLKSDQYFVRNYCKKDQFEYIWANKPGTSQKFYWIKEE
jgi:hypothetical protein